MIAQDELGRLRQQMHELRVPSGHQPGALKEIVRQLELRLAAQLQEKLALENRMYGLVPWITTLFLASFAYEGLKQPGLLLSRLAFIGGWGMASIFVMLAPADVLRLTRSWCYAGSSMPGTDVSEDTVLRDAIGRYVKGVDENERTLRILRITIAAPLVVVILGWLLMIALLGEPPKRPE